MAKQSQIFTVRNKDGQRLGTFAAFTAKQAIQKHIDSQVAYFSTFRSRQTNIGTSSDYTAQVEPPFKFTSTKGE